LGYVDVPERGQPLDRLTDRRAADPQRRREIALGGQALARHELAERDRRDQPVGHVLTAAAELDRLQDRQARDVRHQRAPPYQPAMKRASVRAPSTIDESS